jgi:hypothetical protein
MLSSLAQQISASRQGICSHSYLIYVANYSGNQVKDDKMGCACNIHGKDEKCKQDIS